MREEIEKLGKNDLLKLIGGSGGSRGPGAGPIKPTYEGSDL